MIAKGRAISHGGNAIGYAMREGKMERMVGRNMVDGDTPADILREFEAVNQHNYRCKNKYLRFEIGIAPQDAAKLKPEDMTRIAYEFARRMGLENHQWIACTHKDTGKPHIHLIANRVGVDGKVFDTTFMSNRSARIAEELSRDMGLTIANEVHRQKPHKEVHADPDRQQAKERLQRIAYSELKGNKTLAGLLHGLERHGVGIEPAKNKQGNAIEQMLISKAQENGWEYVPASELPRDTSEVMVEPWVKEALLRLNPTITPEQADEVIFKIRTHIISAQAHDLITANERFHELVFEKNTYPFGKDGEYIPVKLFDMDDIRMNRYTITNQWMYPMASNLGGKRLDVVMLVNGIPTIVGETKSPVRGCITWGDGAADIQSYEQSIPQMFVTNILNFATEGKAFRYGSIGAPLTKWGPWYEGEIKTEGSLVDVARSFKQMFRTENILDIMRYFSIFATDKRHRKMKIVCRYQQFEGANAIVDRVVAGAPRKGLIWHFQGSGKSLLMVFAAQKLRAHPKLKSPTVVIVDDRRDLESQITADFMNADIPNLASANSKEELIEFFRGDQRKILITTIFKFGDVTECLCNRKNVILMVDEAHRTQEKRLGEKMRVALPEAFFFGLTGTPINRQDHNTFATFGAESDKSGYMSRYSFVDSIKDGATLKLEFEPVPVELKIDKKSLDEEFAAMTDQISPEDKTELVRKTNTEALFTAPNRISRVCEHIVRHFQNSVEPTGLKAQVVVYNRDCCVAYKKEIDTLLGRNDATAIVMHAENDKAGKFKEWKLSKDEEAKLLDRFRDPMDPLKIVIVTSKLLTGFDAPILQCMYLDKPMKDHTLLQAICRTNRVYDDHKTCGLIVDYVGIFDDVAKSLKFDDASLRKVISNINELEKEIPGLIKKCCAHFPKVDRKISGYDGLVAAQQCLPTNDHKDRFAADFRVLSHAWEIVSPNPSLSELKSDYVWLCQVYESIKPVSGKGSLVWKVLGPKTVELVHRHVQTVDIGHNENSLESLVLDADVLTAAISEADAKKKIKEVEQLLTPRLRKKAGDPKFKALADKLEELRDKMAQNLKTSIEFLKELLTIAHDLLNAEQEVEPQDNRQKARAALTELFESVKSTGTPVVVESIVNDIDNQIVSIVRNFNDAFKTITGKREVQQQLRSILWIKYKIKDQEVFDKAYRYIEMYY
jgi:type I restriction enzyme R subunit